jgi:hypothetical protein
MLHLRHSLNPSLLLMPFLLTAPFGLYPLVSLPWSTRRLLSRVSRITTVSTRGGGRCMTRRSLRCKRRVRRVGGSWWMLRRLLGDWHEVMDDVRKGDKGVDPGRFLHGKTVERKYRREESAGTTFECRMRWNLATILAVETRSGNSIGNNRRTVRPVTDLSNLHPSPHPSFKCGRQCW